MSQKRITALVLAAAALVLTSCQKSGGTSGSAEDPAQTTGVAVQVQEVTASTISSENKVSGRVEADSEYAVMIGSSVKCTGVYVRAGDTVRAGQTLCTLDLSSTLSSYSAANITYQSAVQSYQDQKAVFDAQLALLEKNVNDLKALFEIGAASQIEIDQAELQLLSSQAQRDSTLAQLEAGMQSYKSNLEQLDTVLEHVDSRGNVIAPTSGILVSLNVEENSFTSPSMPVAVINGAEQMKVAVSVSEALVPKLAIGDEVDVAVTAANQTFTGTIRSLERAANLQTKLYTVTISIPAGTEGLLSGMFADVTFRTDTSDNTIVVPTEAVLTSGNTQYVYVVENGTTARYVEVSTGLTGSGVTEIASGLTPGQQLVIVGQAYLSDGETVRIVSGED